MGRWTQTSIVYDVNACIHVLVKDSWWVLLDGIQLEGVVYATLRRHSVPNIHHCLLAGDVSEDDYHRSQMDKFTGRFWNHPNMQTVMPHWHYCLVLGTIGKKLHEFNKSQQLVKAMRASLLGKLTKCWQSRNIFTCITAHQAACNAGILHRDISSSNIMLVKLEENIQDGMLINWDLSKSFDPEKPDAACQLT